MQDSRRELLEKIRLGEDSFLELKGLHLAAGQWRAPSQESLADELAAFANSAGGVLLLGVADNHDITGIPPEQLDAVETLVRQACLQSIKPPLAPTIERLTLPDAHGHARAIIRVNVPRSLFVHQSPGGYLHRIGSARQQMPPDYLARLFQQRSQSRLIRFDETPVPRATLDDLDEALWQRFAPESFTDAPHVMLGKLAMAAQDENGHWCPTVTGLLMGSRHATSHLPSAFIQAVAYRGEQVQPGALYQIDARDISGPLDQQIFDACTFVHKNMKIAASKHPQGGRMDIPQYDMAAVFEAIANAVAHRDYSISGSKVRLRLFANRLELYSPGMLANAMTCDSLPLRQAARNEAIASLLARCPIPHEQAGGWAWELRRTHIMDRRGEGVPIIFEQTIRLAGQAPVYQMIGQSELLLTIPAANPETPQPE